MRPEELAELIRKRPFQPLRLHLTDGSTFDVHHPDQVIILKGRVDVGVNPDPRWGVVDWVEHISLLHIVRVEVLAPTPASSK